MTLHVSLPQELENKVQTIPYTQPKARIKACFQGNFKPEKA